MLDTIVLLHEKVKKAYRGEYLIMNYNKYNYTS